jgi:ketosteroid isomerase-like protein
MRAFRNLALGLTGFASIIVCQRFFVSPVFAQHVQGSTEKTLLRYEDDWAKALIRRDTVYFRRMLAPGFVYTEDAAMMTADEVVTSAGSGPDRVEWAGNEGMKVHDFGNTAVVTGILIVKGRGTSGPFDRHYRFTDTWQKRNGRWQIVAAQDYLMPPK